MSPPPSGGQPEKLRPPLPRLVGRVGKGDCCCCLLLLLKMVRGAKFDKEQVKQIRKDYKTMTGLKVADKWNTSINTLNKIINKHNPYNYDDEPEPVSSPKPKFVVKKTPKVEPEPAPAPPPAPPAPPKTFIDALAAAAPSAPPSGTLPPAPYFPASPDSRSWSLSNDTEVGFKGNVFDAFRVDYQGVLHHIVRSNKLKSSVSWALFKSLYYYGKDNVKIVSPFHFGADGRGYFSAVLPLTERANVYLTAHIYCNLRGNHLAPYEIDAMYYDDKLILPYVA